MPRLTVLFLFFAVSVAAAKAPLVPDPSLTPGQIDSKLTTKALCAPGFRTGTVRAVSAAEHAEVFRRYKIDKTTDRFEIDHLISLELGGTNDVTNLWPQSYTTQPLNATVKDGLENRLHHLVCTQGTDHIPLAEAQQAIRTDWEAAYKKYLCDAHIKLTDIQSAACASLKHK